MFYGPGVTDDPATPWVEAPGQLFYPADVLPGTTATFPSVHPEMFGDTILVNGQAWPVMDVEPRMYRFRVLDGSNSAFYNLRLAVQHNPNQPVLTGPFETFFQVGTDDGLLAAPVPLSELLIAPGERADIVVDFSQLAGKTILLINNAKGPFPKGAPIDPLTTGQIMAFRVNLPMNPAVPNTVLPVSLNTITPLVPTTPTPRELALYEGFDPYLRLEQNLGTLAGPLKLMDPITEVIRRGIRRPGRSITPRPTRTRSTCTRSPSRSSAGRSLTGSPPPRRHHRHRADRTAAGAGCQRGGVEGHGPDEPGRGHDRQGEVRPAGQVRLALPHPRARDTT
jgi:hypothetical protein